MKDIKESVYHGAVVSTQVRYGKGPVLKIEQNLCNSPE